MASMNTRYDHLPMVGDQIIIVPEDGYRLYAVVDGIMSGSDNGVILRMTLQTVPDPEPYID